MLRQRLALPLLIALALTASSASLVLAKGDAIATLDTSLPSDPEPGSELTIGWTVVTQVDGGTPAPFNAEAVFIRLVSPSGEAVEAVGHQDPVGHYTATIVVPAGGIADVEVGLRGESCIGGVCERSDMMFAVAEAPEQPAPAVIEAAPQVQEPIGNQPSGEAPSTPNVDFAILLAILGGVAVLAGIGATMVRGRGLQPGSGR